MAFTYILRCSDDSYYVGSTLDLDRRTFEHNSPDLGALYTRRRRPVTVRWSATFESIADAFAFEKRVQGWSRAKREALIRGELDELPGLARRGHLRRAPGSPGFEAGARAPAPQPPER